MGRKSRARRDNTVYGSRGTPADRAHPGGGAVGSPAASSHEPEEPTPPNAVGLWITLTQYVGPGIPEGLCQTVGSEMSRRMERHLRRRVDPQLRVLRPGSGDVHHRIEVLWCQDASRPPLDMSLVRTRAELFGIPRFAREDVPWLGPLVKKLHREVVGEALRALRPGLR